jgi:hypothetical protein
MHVSRRAVWQTINDDETVSGHRLATFGVSRLTNDAESREGGLSLRQHNWWNVRQVGNDVMANGSVLGPNVMFTRRFPLCKLV